MKAKLLSIAVVALLAMPANAWYVAENGDIIEDFETAPEATTADNGDGITIVKHPYEIEGSNVNNPTGAHTALPSVEVRDDNGNHYMYVHHTTELTYKNDENIDCNKDGAYSQLSVAYVTLPEGKTLDDYSKLIVNAQDCTTGWLSREPSNPKEDKRPLFITFANRAELGRVDHLVSANKLNEGPLEFEIKEGTYNKYNEVPKLIPTDVKGKVGLGFRINTNDNTTEYGIDNITLVAKPTPTGIKSVNNDNANIRIQGSTVSGNGMISAYTVDGTLAAQGNGSIELTPGMYIVICNGKSMKCIIR